MIAVEAVLILTGIYLGCGLLFALVFAVRGAGKIDPYAAHGSWGFRLLIIPGATVLWPVLLKRWMARIESPPPERNAHRLAALANSSIGEPS